MLTCQNEAVALVTDVSDVLQLSVQQAGVLGVNSCNTDGFTPLHVAALHGHAALAAMLIRHGANVNARTNQSTTPLHLASQNSHIQVGPSELGQVLQTMKLFYIYIVFYTLLLIGFELLLDLC